LVRNLNKLSGEIFDVLIIGGAYMEQALAWLASMKISMGLMKK
jgi:hypothetical protein